MQHCVGGRTRRPISCRFRMCACRPSGRVSLPSLLRCTRTDQRVLRVHSPGLVAYIRTNLSFKNAMKIHHTVTNFFRGKNLELALHIGIEELVEVEPIRPPFPAREIRDSIPVLYIALLAQPAGLCNVREDGRVKVPDVGVDWGALKHIRGAVVGVNTDPKTRIECRLLPCFPPSRRRGRRGCISKFGGRVVEELHDAAYAERYAVAPSPRLAPINMILKQA